jgi:MFS family permease
MLLTYGAQYSFGVFFSAMLSELGWSRTSLAGAFSLYSLVYIGLSFFSGRLTDRLGPRWVIALGGCFLGGGMLLVGFIRTPWQFYLAYGLIAGIGMSAAYVPCNVTVVKWFVRRRGLAIGITGSGASLGIAGFPPLSEALITHFGWRTTYLLFGVAVLLALNILARFMVHTPETLGLRPDGDALSMHDDTVGLPSDDASWSLSEAIRTGRFWLLASVMMLSLSTIPSAYVHLPQYAQDLNLSVPRSTFIMIVGLFALLGNLLLGHFSDLFGRRGALLGALVIGTIAFGGFTMAQGAPMLYAASACFGFYYGTFASLYPAVVGDYFGRLHVGSLTGFCFALGSIPSALGPALMGWVADYTGRYGFAFLAGTLINALVVCLFVLAKPPHRAVRST